jgi:putative flavoprotein involved in K+ transport
MGTEHVETVVIGGGQAGLATGYHLARLGRPFVILDDHQQVGDSWRRHWDSLRLYSPAQYDGLPGMPFPARRWHYPTKDELADFLEAYAERFALPVRGGLRVSALAKEGERYVVTAGEQRFVADNVVVATGTFGRPYVPELAARLRPQIRQLHSSDYHRLADLQPGPVLVVGGSHSGGDIAYEAAAEHSTVLCGRDTGQIPVRVDSKRARLVVPVLWLVWNHVLTVRTPIGRKVRDHIRFHGGPLLRVRKPDLAARGVERVVNRVTDVQDGLPCLDDGRVLDVANVVWCTGFRQDFGWIQLPVTGDDGWPLEHLGVVERSPGLYFCGLAFQSAFASMLVGGAGRDAEHVAKQISRRATSAARAGSRATVGATT